jgi:hypothetical protein
MATTEVDEDVDGGPLVGAARTIIEVDEDIDGGPPGRCCREFQQRPPPKLMRMLMAPPLAGATGRSGSGHHRS